MLWCGHHDYKVRSVTGNLDIKWDSGRKIPLIYPFFTSVTGVLGTGDDLSFGLWHLYQALGGSIQVKVTLCFHIQIK